MYHCLCCLCTISRKFLNNKMKLTCSLSILRIYILYIQCIVYIWGAKLREKQLLWNFPHLINFGHSEPVVLAITRWKHNGQQEQLGLRIYCRTLMGDCSNVDMIAAVFRICISFHADPDPDPGSEKCPYGSGSKEVNTKEE